MAEHQSTPHVYKDALTNPYMSPRTIGEIIQDILPIIVNAQGPFEFVGGRPTGKFKDAANDEMLTRGARTLAIAEGINPGEGHDAVFGTFLNLGGIESEYDPARWELLRNDYPANRGW